MNKTKLKQGTLEWEKARETRIGGSEIFDIVRYYATDTELQNCGINAESFKKEKPYTSVWALYHKILADGFYRKEALDPEYAEYGHAVEPYGLYVLQQGRSKKLKAGEVYADDRLIASLDISGTAEKLDVVPFDYGNGMPKEGQRFACEQKSMMPQKLKEHIPFKHIVQAQYQITSTKADFFILQIMVLKNDSPFLRGKVCQMTKKQRYKFLEQNMSVINLYFKNNYHLAELIKTCTERFFKAVSDRVEPTPYIEYDSQQNIIECIRCNSYFNADKTITYNLEKYLKAKKSAEDAEIIKKSELQKIIEKCKENNACLFSSPDGATAKFSKNGRFLIREVINS